MVVVVLLGVIGVDVHVDVYVSDDEEESEQA